MCDLDTSVVKKTLQPYDFITDWSMMVDLKHV